MTLRTKAKARKARHRANKAFKPDRVANVNVSDLPNMVDAIFDGDYEIPGWVTMAANDKGRDLINGLFSQ